MTIEEIHEVAAKRGGKCLSKTYKNTRVKLLWQCKYGHRWKSSYKVVGSGSWCPKCAVTKPRKKKYGKKLFVYISKRLAKTIGDGVRTGFERL